MRRIYWVWALGLLLKGIGASWDVSWHFRTLREAISPPHIVNIIGGVICAFALVQEWRHRDQRRTGGLLVVLAGLGLFLLAMPFDQWWHTRFGVDLTTWSPAHMMLFTGTMVSVFGVLLLYVGDLTRGGSVRNAIRKASGSERAMLAFFLIFFAGAVYFPLTYNEYATVAARMVVEDPGSMDPELVALAQSTDDPIFLGTPHWLYPVYSIGIAVFLGTLARAWLGRGWALVALGGIALERAVADGILGALGWPTAAIPLQFAAMGIAIELVWLIRAPMWPRAIAGALLAAGAGYAYLVAPISWRDSVPLTADSWPAGLVVALAAAVGALLFVQRGLRYVEGVPDIRVADVRAWIATKWAPTDLNR